MPRKPRKFIEGGIYHVFNRGNNRQEIFEDADDFECFMKLLHAGQIRETVKIYHYCLMPNHFHLLIRNEKRESLSRFMHWVQLGYVRYFKTKNETTGHVFEERYRNLLIADESYYLQCGRYIERNPVKAEMVSRAEDYVYSSAAYYVKGQRDPLITENLYYKKMGNSPEKRRQNYKEFLSRREPYEELITDQLLKY